MKKAFVSFMFVVYVCAGFVTYSQTKPTNAADVKIRQRMSMGTGGATETVLYIKGQRMRNEMGSGGMGFTTILQCDLKRTLTINERTKTYMVSSTDRPNTAMGVGDGGATGMTPRPQNEQTPPRGGVVNITNTITDTGERKEMFGFTARHIKTSMVKKASPEACDKDQKIETDGWYIDFQYAFECPGQTQKIQTPPVQSQPGCKDDVRTRTIGSAKLGFPLLVTTTIYQADGRTSTMTQEVLELSRESLSASLFDVPEGYALAKDMQELYGMGSIASATSNRPTTNISTESSSQPNSSGTMTTPSTEKKPGVIRVGLVMPKVQMSAGNAAQTAEAVRNGFAQYLQGPSVEVVPLTAIVASAIIAEARQKQCDYVLYVSMTVKKGGGGGMFSRAIGNIAGSAAGNGSAAITKSKDEISLEYRLDKTENASTILANTEKAKAKSDGDDILTPLIQSAVQTIVSTIRA